MAKQLDIPLGGNFLSVTKSTVGAPGGGTGVRVIIDDAIVLSKSDAHILLRQIENALMGDTWPLA